MGTIVPVMSTCQRSIIAEALFPKAKRRILSILFSRPEQSFYLRELIRKADVGRGAVQREVQSLTEAGILSMKRIGNQVHYSANPKLPVYEELASLFKKTLGQAGLIQERLSTLQGIDAALIYGSTVRGEETVLSDIDLLIIGDVTLSEINSALAPIELDLGRAINPSLYRKNEFRKKMKDGNHFLSTVFRNPREVIIDDSEIFGKLEE